MMFKLLCSVGTRTSRSRPYGRKLVSYVSSGLHPVPEQPGAVACCSVSAFFSSWPLQISACFLSHSLSFETLLYFNRYFSTMPSTRPALFYSLLFTFPTELFRRRPHFLLLSFSLSRHGDHRFFFCKLGSFSKRLAPTVEKTQGTFPG